MFKIDSDPYRIAKPCFNPHRPEKLAACDTRNLSVQCASLDSDEIKSIADRVLNPEIVATAPDAKWINLLQIDSFIPPFLAILLKHCVSDRDTFKKISRTILQEQLNQGILTDNEYQFLLQTLNSEKFEKVYKYLYAAAVHHRTKGKEPTTDVVAELNEKWFFQINDSIDQLRLRYVRSQVEAWLKDVQVKHPEAKAQCLKTLGTQTDPVLFRKELAVLLGQLKTPSDGNRLKGIYYKEMLEQLNKYPKENAVLLVHELLKAQDFYEQWDCNVGGLCDELERSIAKSDVKEPSCEGIVKRCNKAYNAVALLLSDHKNIRCASVTAYAETYGRLRHRFRVLDFEMRKKLGSEHIFCNCHYQTAKEKSSSFAWPVISEKLVNLTKCTTSPVGENLPPSVFIATQNFGFGNRHTAGTLGAYYGRAGFDVNVVDIPMQVLKERDRIFKITSHWPFSKIFGKGLTEANFYNWLVKNNYWGIIHILRKLTAGGDPAKETVQSKQIREAEIDLIRRNLLMHRPDIMVSTAAWHEEHLLSIAKELNMPMLQVSSDLDYSRTWKKPTEYPNYRFAAAIEYPTVEKNINGSLKKDQIEFIGSGIVDPALIPVRSPEEIADLKKKMGIDPKKNVVMLMNGGCGCYSRYPEALAKRFKKEEGDIHFIAICGKNEAFRKHLVKNVLPYTKMSMDIRGDVSKREDMNDILDVIDLAVTKPGGVSTMEIARKGKRMLFDDTLHSDLTWERINMDVVSYFKMGKAFTNPKNFYQDLRQSLNEKPICVKDNPFAKNNPEKMILEMTKSMIKKSLELQRIGG